MAGRGSLAGLLPYGDANAIVVDMAREVLPVVRETPVLAGVCGTDPFRLMPVFLAELKRLGFCGVQNFPTVGLIDGTFRAGPGGDRHGLRPRGRDDPRRPASWTCSPRPTSSPRTRRAAMAEAGADVLVPHMGLTTGGAIGAESALTLDEAVERVQALHDAAKAVNPDILVLCHGGPIAEPEDAAHVLRNTRGRGRLLRRLEHGAAADRGGDDGEHEAVQGDRDRGGAMKGRFIKKRRHRARAVRLGGLWDG